MHTHEHPLEHMYGEGERRDKTTERQILNFCEVRYNGLNILPLKYI